MLVERCACVVETAPYMQAGLAAPVVWSKKLPRDGAQRDGGTPR